MKRGKPVRIVASTKIPDARLRISATAKKLYFADLAAMEAFAKQAAEAAALCSDGTIFIVPEMFERIIFTGKAIPRFLRWELEVGVENARLTAYVGDMVYSVMLVSRATGVVEIHDVDERPW